MAVKPVSDYKVVFQKEFLGFGNKDVFVDQPCTHHQPIHVQFF